MTADPARRRRATVVAGAIGAVAAVLVPVALWAAARAITTSDSAVLVTSTPVLAIPETPVAVLATTDEDGALTSVTALALAPQGSGGTVVSIPAVTVRTPPADSAAGPAPDLGTVWRDEGVEGLDAAIVDLLHARITAIAVLDPVAAAVALNPRGTPTGQDLVAALTDPALATGVGEPWARLGDAWRAYIAPGVEAAEAAAGDVWERHLAAMFSAPTAYHQFAVLDVDEATVSLDRAEVAVVMASVAPGAVLAVSPGFAVQLDSAFDFGVTTRGVEALLELDANVQLVRQIEGVGGSVTQVSSWLPLSADDVAVFTQLFGPVEIVDPTQRVEGVDVTVVLGSSFADSDPVPSS